MELTNEMVLSDIAGFKARISEAEAKLFNLPATAADWKGKQKLKVQRHELEDEIRHCRQLIVYATEPLTGKSAGIDQSHTPINYKWRSG